MWISKKKYNHAILAAQVKVREDNYANEQNTSLWLKIAKLERKVKKLEKQIREGV